MADGRPLSHGKTRNSQIRRSLSSDNIILIISFQPYDSSKIAVCRDSFPHPICGQPCYGWLWLIGKYQQFHSGCGNPDRHPGGQPFFCTRGGSVTLIWTSSNASAVTINSTIVQPASGGTTIVSPSQTTTYTATASANGSHSSASATVTIIAGNSFQGMSAQGAGNPSETDVDPNGAVGTKQFMEYVNTQYQAYDKTTFAPVWEQPQPFATPWTSSSKPIPECSGNNITLDAVINFDRLASRWILAAKAADTSGNYYFCIAISSGDDLSSANWYPYYFPLAALNLPSNYLPDWPKLGTWPDAYYATLDLFDTSANVEADVGVLACAFDRADMLQGMTMKTPQCFQGPSSLLSNGIYLGHSLIPADVDGTTPPAAGRDEFMVSIENPTNNGTATTSDSLNLLDFHVDWTTPANSTFTQSSLPVATYAPGCYLFQAGFPGVTNCVPEPAASNNPQYIDSVGDRLMPRFAYRNFGSYESFLVSQTISTALNSQTPWQTGIRWYELRDNGSGTPAVNQYGLVSPDNSLYRFLPSIAQDGAGNAAVGYSVSNASTDPAIDFSYWSLTTANATPSEVGVLSGSGEEVSGRNGFGEWGTYSSMTVDPVDDCTFWYVNEYWPNNSGWATRIAFFPLPGCN